MSRILRWFAYRLSYLILPDKILEDLIMACNLNKQDAFNYMRDHDIGWERHDKMTLAIKYLSNIIEHREKRGTNPKNPHK
jgi:hypothetical protein